MNRGEQQSLMPRRESLQDWRRKSARALMRTVFGRAPEVAHPGLLPSVGIHRILVCRISHTLGNTLLLTPLLRELHTVYPGSEIDVVTRSPVGNDIFGGFPWVRRIYRLPAHGIAAPWRVVAILRALRATRYDLAIDPCLRSQSDRIGVLMANAVRKLGYSAPGKSGNLNYGIPAPKDLRHLGQLPVYLLRSVLGRHNESYPSLDICLTPTERAQGAALLAPLVCADSVRYASTRCIGLFANATGVKFLGADWWQRFSVRLAERAPPQRIIEIVPVGGASLLDDRFPTFYSSDLRRLASVISALAMFISADCGVMHLACASGAPTVGLFSATDPAQWGPYGPRDTVLTTSQRTPEQVADAVPLLL